MTKPGFLSHCSHWGAYQVRVEEGRIAEVIPHEFDEHPSPLIQSIRGWTDPTRRVLGPMVRKSWLADRLGNDRSLRGAEPFVEVSWDQALDLVAEEIRRVSGEFGNASIFAGSYGWTSCGRFHHASGLLKRMLNLCGGFTDHRDTYSVAAGQALLRHTLGTNGPTNGMVTGLDSIAEHTETLLVFGALTPRTAQNEAGGLGMHTLENHLKRLVERRVRIIHISPQKDDIPEWVGAEWWPIRPGADTALMLALAQEIIRADAHDREFLDRACSGADEFLAYLSGNDGVEKTAEWAAEITGLDAEKIRALAGLMPKTRTMMAVSWSLQRARHGEQPYWAALGLASVLGQIGLPGGGVGYGYGSLGGVGAAIGLSNSPAMDKGDNPIDSFIPVARITDMLARPGGSFDYEGETRSYPDVRLVYWAGGNPFHHHQDLNRLEKLWAKPETIIVQEPMWTATARRADILLPASTSLERNDLAGNRRSDRIVAMQKIIEPMGKSRADFDIFADIAARMGVGDEFTEGRDEMTWIRHLYEECRADAARRFDHEMPEFERFWQEGAAEIVTAKQHVYMKDFREDPEANPLPTESGKIVLGSQLLAEKAYPDCPSHPAWLEPEEWGGELRPGQPGCFILMSPQPRGRLHSQLESEPESLSMKKGGREQVRLHPDDAAVIGVSDGQLVRLSNHRGACLAIADITDLVRPGVACLPTGAWLSSENGVELSGNPNVLTSDEPTSHFGQGCAAHGCMVRIEPEQGEFPEPYAEYQRYREAMTG